MKGSSVRPRADVDAERCDHEGLSTCFRIINTNKSGQVSDQDEINTPKIPSNRCKMRIKGDAAKTKTELMKSKSQTSKLTNGCGIMGNVGGRNTVYTLMIDARKKKEQTVCLSSYFHPF